VSAVTAEEVRAVVLDELAEPIAGLGVAPEEMPDDFDLLTSGLIDSLGLMELIASVNERLGLDIDYEDLDPEGLTVLGTFSGYVASASAADAR